MKHLSLTIYGKVQGVFFRLSAKEKAEELGICGWIKNNSDGTVSIEAEGEQKDLDAFAAWCRNGPPNSKIESIHKEQNDNLQNYSTFDIFPN
ncbi:MAG: acylphosphatase [Patescibacteria group bacterium]|nr:acylphosphatase [Patescibacteria group bacterium]